MTKKMYLGVESLSRPVRTIYLGVGNESRKVVKGYIGVNNESRLFWQAEPSIECCIPVMTSNSAPEGTASCSTYYSSGSTKRYAYMAMDEKTSTFWAPNSTNKVKGWVQYRFPCEVLPTKMTFRTGATNHHAKAFVFSGSADGSSWTELCSGTFENSTSLQTFPIVTSEMFTCFRLTVSSAWSTYARVPIWNVYGLRY